MILFLNLKLFFTTSVYLTYGIYAAVYNVFNTYDTVAMPIEL